MRGLAVGPVIVTTGGIVSDCVLDCNSSQRQVAGHGKGRKSNEAETRPHKFQTNCQGQPEDLERLLACRGMV